jgi:hypothetical protein
LEETKNKIRGECKCYNARIDHREQRDEEEVGGIDGSTEGMVGAKEERKGME